MRLMLIKKDKIYNIVLPKKIYGVYYLEDKDQKGNTRKLINIEESENRWKIISNSDAKILSNNENTLDSVILEDYNFYKMYIPIDKEMTLLYASPFCDNTQIMYKVKNEGSFLIGNDKTNHITYKTSLISKNHAKITYQNSFWTIESLDPKNYVYVNGLRVSNKKLLNGDIVFIFGLKLIIVGNNIIINNPRNLVECNKNCFEQVQIQRNFDLKEDIIEDENEISLFEEKDYFFRAPRFRTLLEEKTIQIDSPPSKEKQEEIPLIYTLGPMLTMGLTSLVTGITTLMNILNKKQTLSSGLSSLVIAVAMLMTMILWPMLSKNFQKKKKKEREKKRREKYSKYIDERRQNILTTIATQRQILIENGVPLDECKSIIINKKRNLWERKIEHDDFLNLRLGVGNVDSLVNVVIPEQHFSLDEDDLKELLTKLDLDTKTMSDVPITVSFVEKNVSAIIGDLSLTNKFINGLILQLIAFHSYEDLKIVIFTNEENQTKWNNLKILPHCFSDDKQVRFFATNVDEYNQLSNYLSEIYFNRKSVGANNSKDFSYKNVSPYFLILTDDFSSIKNLDIITNILNQNINLGFSLIINNSRLLGLPNECSLFITIDKNSSGLFENELIQNKQKPFVADIDESLDLEYFARIVANIPIDFEKSKFQLPNCLTFLEMYNVGKVEQLNSIVRWKNNNPIVSLQAPVGIGENGELFRLDIHEKFHGPHGLVAGMTGSGKSEFLISYILSMAVNYNPNEVSFVLIDYKGGGLAGAFENKETGVKLPHIAGTITNLDINDMKRSLASIDSELKLRQKKFNEAREMLNESTIDIYKYQKLYRSGKVKEPIPHLIIISDEFAELKAQQPEFMEKLISTARIGRSLGVHLILATQKPSGVVNDQIWSNSKFRVCLKVQDKSDSMDMIKRPEAASLKNVGRFYLQVGYNEFFALGQSAWAGAPYYKLDKRKKKIDSNIDFIDNVGEVIKSLDIERPSNILVPSGEELPNIVKYLSDLAIEQNIIVNKLWLNKIPELIFIDNLANKYNYQVKKFNINPIIGEYDVPNKQEQHLLTLPLSDEGNTILYGSSSSGKELFLNDVIYSTIKNHGPEEVNFYILDFGSETLKVFEKAPHVGEILTSIDTEKIENFFKMLKTIINVRKKIFQPYNGDYKFYCEHSGKSLPTIICIINNYEAFVETYSDYEDEVVKFTREGTKYGIVFIFTVSVANSIRYKLKQNFKQEICLQLNDVSDYNSIYGSVNKLYPAKIYGRGLIKLDNIYEFQTAHPCVKEDMQEEIKKLCLDLSTNSKIRAMKVPILPLKVGLNEVKEKINDISGIPIGIDKETLGISLYDFKRNPINLITSRNEDEFKYFVPTFIDVVANIQNTQIIVFDAKKIVKQKNNKFIYINNNFDTYFEQLSNYFNEILKNKNNEEYLNKIKESLIIIIGFEEYKNKLSLDNQKNIFKLFTDIKQLNKISIVLIDSINKLKKYELDEWYKNSVSNSDAIWLGNGLSEQYLIKISNNPKIIREKISLGFGFKIKDGNPVLIKYLCDLDLTEETNE